MKKEFIAYQGQEFTIEWFYDQNNKSSVLEYYNSLSLERKKQLFKLLRSMGDTGKIFNKEKFRFEGDQIYAFKPKPDRFLCFFFRGQKIIITNAFEKKCDKLPSTEKDKELRYKGDYIKRVHEGTYYD